MKDLPGLVYLPKFCITMVFDFSWDNCNIRDWKQWLCKIARGVNKVHCGLCENGKRNDSDSDYVSHNTGEAQVSLQELTQNKKAFGSKTKAQYQSLKISN